MSKRPPLGKNPPINSGTSLGAIQEERKDSPWFTDEKDPSKPPVSGVEVWAETIPAVRNSLRISPKAATMPAPSKIRPPHARSVPESHPLSYERMKRLRVVLSSGDSAKIQDFIDKKGLKLLVSVMHTCWKRLHGDHRAEKRTGLDIATEYETVKCVKAVASVKMGVRALMNADGIVPALVRAALSSPLMRTQTTAMELLAGICIVPDAYKKVLQEFADGKRFQALVSSLTVHHLSESKHPVACMSFINALVTAPEDLEHRVHLRDELFTCGLRDVLQLIRAAHADSLVSAELAKMLDVFDEDMQFDQMLMGLHMNTKVEALSPARKEPIAVPAALSIALESEYEMTSVFETLKREVSLSSYQTSFRSALKQILELSTEKELCGPKIWMLLERFVKRTLDALRGASTSTDSVFDDLMRNLNLCFDRPSAPSSSYSSSSLSASTLSVSSSSSSSPGPLPLSNLPTTTPSSLTSPKSPTPHRQAANASASPVLVIQQPITTALNASSSSVASSSANSGSGRKQIVFKGESVRSRGLSQPDIVVPQPSTPPSTTTRQKLTLPSFHWLAIPPERFPHTFWRDLAPAVLNDCKFDIQKLEELFGQPIGSPEPRAHRLTFVDPLRAKHLVVWLTQSKMTSIDIKEAILHQSSKESLLTEELIIDLKPFLPTLQEFDYLVSCATAREMLGTAERFVLELSDIPKLERRVSNISFRLKFESTIESLKPDIEALSKATEEVMQSKKFSKVLQYVLVLGSILNGSPLATADTFVPTFSASAPRGFRLISLERLSQTNASRKLNGISNLMHFLVLSLSSTQPQLLTFADELSHVDHAAKIPLKNIHAIIDETKKAFALLEEEMSEVANSPSDATYYRLTKEFHTRCKEPFIAIAAHIASVESRFHTMVEMFGEKATVCSLEEFFGCISRFVESFEEARLSLASQKVRGIDKLISAARTGEAIQERRVTRKMSISLGRAPLVK